MNQEEFEQIFESTHEKIRDTLITKAREYASDGDRLHNFKKAAALNEQTSEQALWGFVTKHIVSVSDMVASGKTFSDEVWDEKLGDILVYSYLLRAIVEERKAPEDKAPVYNFTTVNTN